MPSEPTGAQVIPFAFAERVLRVDGKLQAVNIQTPICGWQNGQLQLRGFRLPERLFAGYAYRMPAPGWFQFENGGVSFPTQIRDPADSVERRWHTTPLGQLSRHPEMRLALAQDKLAATLAPLLGIPDLLIGEDRLWRDWEVERPTAAAQARVSADGIEAACTGLSSDALRLRLCIRRAAMRRMDATAVGREVFLPCPAYFGEPHLVFALPRGLAFKAGIVRMANSWPKPETEVRSVNWRADPELVWAAETCLFPLPPPGPQAAEKFAAMAAEWLALAPLREFEARSQLPLFPHTTIYPYPYVPRGFRIRIRPESVRACGGSYLTLAAAGLSPYIAEAFDDYCQKRQDLLAAWVQDIVGLAIAKWG